MAHPLRPPGSVRIRPAPWCLTRLSEVTPGLLVAHGDTRRLSVAVSCVAERDDLVLVVRGRAELTWALVWTAVTVEVTGTSAAGLPWLVRASGTCERERLPGWAASRWAREVHPAHGGAAASLDPPLGLRLRSVGLHGYSVLPRVESAG